MGRIAENSPYLMSDDRHRPFATPSANIETGEPCERCMAEMMCNADTGRFYCPECSLMPCDEDN